MLPAKALQLMHLELAIMMGLLLVRGARHREPDWRSNVCVRGLPNAAAGGALVVCQQAIIFEHLVDQLVHQQVAPHWEAIGDDNILQLWL